MKKTIYGIVGFIALLLASSAYTQRKTAPAVGYFAPELSVGTTEAISVSAYRGEYLLLTFWDSTRADSRLAVNQYQQWYDSTKESESRKIAFMAVNLDTNKRMFEEIVKRDCLDRTCQFHPGADQHSAIIERFRLESQSKSFLVAPDGRIIAVNPTIDELKQI